MRSGPECRAEVIALLRAFSAADSALGRQFAKQQRMHPTDAAAIVAILDTESSGGSLTPARLAERIGLSANATSAVVNRLEDAGHVVRTRDNNDRRVVSLYTTAKVHADAEAFFSPIASALEAALAAYPAEQIEPLARLLNELIGVVKTGLHELDILLLRPPDLSA